MNYHFGDTKFSALIYSAAGAGKSVSIATLFKLNPRPKVRFLAFESNALAGLQEGLKIHKIDDLKEGDLIINNLVNPVKMDLDTFMEHKDESMYIKACEAIGNFKGIDVVTGNEVKCGNVLTWEKDKVLVIDGLTMLEFSCAARGHKKALDEKKTRTDAIFYAGQTALINYLFQISQYPNLTLIVLGHEALASEAAMLKYPKLMKVHPAVGTKGIVSGINGRFNCVLYAKYDRQIREYVWSADEEDTQTVVRQINIKDKRYNGRIVTMSKLPADFSFEGYDWF